MVYGKEYFYGGMGIEFCSPVRSHVHISLSHAAALFISSLPQGGTVMGSPHEIIKLGRTQVPYEVFQHYLVELSEEYT